MPSSRVSLTSCWVLPNRGVTLQLGKAGQLKNYVAPKILRLFWSWFVRSSPMNLWFQARPGGGGVLESHMYTHPLRPQQHSHQIS
jgi:hypothetical protein